MEYQKLISIDPNIRFGKPCIKGTRIAVFDVLEWFASGMTENNILHDFPELSSKQIRACMAYASDRTRKTNIAS